jgi:hypothetical protein
MHAWDDVLRTNTEWLMPVRSFEAMRGGLYEVAGHIFDAPRALVDCMIRRKLLEPSATLSSEKWLGDDVRNMWQFFNPDVINCDFWGKTLDFLWDAVRGLSAAYTPYTDQEKKLLPEFWCAMKLKYTTPADYMRRALELAHAVVDEMEEVQFQVDKIEAQWPDTNGP